MNLSACLDPGLSSLPRAGQPGSSCGKIEASVIAEPTMPLHSSVPRLLAAGLVMLVGLMGCAAQPLLPDPASLFEDSRFAKPDEAPDAQALLALNPAMQDYLAGELGAMVRKRGPLQGLVDALYQRRQLQLEYDSARTRTAAEAFDARAGNCLSLVLMTAAFAKALNLEVHFQRVWVDDEWRRVGDLYQASGHVNLTLGKRSRDTRGSFDVRHSLTIDFLPPQALERQRSEEIDQATISGMYMNNRAAESLAEGRVDQAYWWAREAVRLAPAELTGYNTLAVVYLRRGLLRPAEALLRLALARAPDNTRLLANLAQLLAQQGRHDEAQAFALRLARLEPHPPYRDYELGLAALQAGQPERASVLFARELARSPGQPDFHLAMAQAQLALGSVERAREHLMQARELSTSRGEAALYSAKLARLPPPAGPPP